MPDLLLWSEALTRLAIAVVFLAAGVLKLRDLAGFKTVLASYSWLPGPVRGLVGVVLPVFEVTLGLVLLSGFQSEILLGLAALTLAVLAVSYALTFGPQGASDCGCFGGGTEASRSKVLTRNTFLVILALIGLAAGWVDGVEGAGTVMAALVLVSLVAVALTLLRLPRVAPTAQTVGGVPDSGRRRFLQMTAGSLTGMGLAALLGLGQRAPVAEAACHGCGTCGTDYIFLNCVGTCCASYVVQKFNDCDTYCFMCSTSSRVFCGVLECC